MSLLNMPFTRDYRCKLKWSPKTVQRLTYGCSLRFHSSSGGRGTDRPTISPSSASSARSAVDNVPSLCSNHRQSASSPHHSHPRHPRFQFFCPAPRSIVPFSFHSSSGGRGSDRPTHSPSSASSARSAVDNFPPLCSNHRQPASSPYQFPSAVPILLSRAKQHRAALFPLILRRSRDRPPHSYQVKGLSRFITGAL